MKLQIEVAKVIRKRVLLIGTEPKKMTRLKRTLASLRKLNVNVHVFKPYYLPRGFPRPLTSVVRYLAISIKILLSKADIYHFFNIPDIVGLPLVLKRKALIYDVRSPWFSSVLEMTGSRMLSRLAGFIERIMTSSADIIITANTPLAMRARTWGAKEVIVVPNYPPRGFKSKRTQDEMKQLLGLMGYPVVLFLGKLSILEGSELLKQIIYETCEALPNVRFLIVGSGPELESLQRFIRMRKLTEKVHFVGWIEHSKVPDYINAADVCLFPRVHTTFSEYTSPENILKVSEYLAIGKPVIVPRMGGFEDAKFPLIVVEPNEMGSALIAYLKNPRDTGNIDAPTWEVSHQRLRDIYRALGAFAD